MTDSQTAAEQLDTLAPEVSVEIAGRQITMREPTWIEAIELEGAIAPVIETLREKTAADPSADRFILAVMEIMSEHRDVLLEMMAFCAGVERDWINTLSDSDGRTLMMVFWRVNRGFFVRRLSLARALARKPDASAGAKSLPH